MFVAGFCSRHISTSIVIFQIYMPWHSGTENYETVAEAFPVINLYATAPDAVENELFL